MSKRKQASSKDAADDEGDGDSDVSLINVDFDFFDPNSKVDYHALKHLLTQLFQSDAELFHLNELAELILAQPLVGTAIKTDGIEGDPLAYLSVLNMHVHQNHPLIRSLTTYVLQKSSPNPSLHATLQTLLGPEGLQSPNHVGFVFSERLVNMPVQVVPPMYRMLMDEIKWAVDDNEPYRFTHYLFLTRTYRLTAQQAAELQRREDSSARPSKKRKNKAPTQMPAASDNGGVDGGGRGGVSTYSFHPEDEYIQKHATHTLDYVLSTHPQSSHDEDALGLDVAGRMMLVPAEKLGGMVDEMGRVYAVPVPGPQQ